MSALQAILSESRSMNLPSDASSKAPNALNMRRLKVHAQAVESERQYVRALDDAWHSFGHHFISCCTQHWHNQHELSLLLLEIRRILALSCDLIEALQREPDVVAQAFLDWLLLAQPMYESYVYRHKQALDLLNSADELSNPIQKVQNLSHDVSCHALDAASSGRTHAATGAPRRSSSYVNATNSTTLKHLLRLPTKRIGWYERLLRQMLFLSPVEQQQKLKDAITALHLQGDRLLSPIDSVLPSLLNMSREGVPNSCYRSGTAGPVPNTRNRADGEADICKFVDETVCEYGDVLLQGLVDITASASSLDDSPEIELRDIFLLRVTDDGTLILYAISDDAAPPSLFASFPAWSMVLQESCEPHTVNESDGFVVARMLSQQAPVGWELDATFTYVIRAPNAQTRAEWIELLDSLEVTGTYRLHRQLRLNLREDFEFKSESRADFDYSQRRESDAFELESRESSSQRGEGELEICPWARDDSAKQCNLCDRNFTLLRRRHHCRYCGELRCSRCSRHRLVIPRVHKYRAVRVCQRCVGVAKRIHARNISKQESQKRDSFTSSSPSSSRELADPYGLQLVQEESARARDDIDGFGVEGSESLIDRRRQALESLVLSERLFLHQMRLIGCLLTRNTPSVQEEGRGSGDALPPNSSDLFIHSLDHIVHLHQFILNGLQKELLYWTPRSTLASIFLRVSHLLQESYRQYGEVMDMASDSRMGMWKYVPASLVGSTCFTITPVQRLRQYIMYLDKIWRASPLVHDDTEPLQRARKVVYVSLQVCLKARSNSRDLQEAKDIEAEFCHDVKFSRPGRRLLRKGQLELIGRFRSVRRMYHLFSDALVQSSSSKEGFMLEKVYYGNDLSLISTTSDCILVSIPSEKKRLKLRAVQRRQQKSWSQSFQRLSANSLHYSVADSCPACSPSPFPITPESDVLNSIM